MPIILQEEVEEASETYVSHIMLVSGLALFLVDGVISAISAFKTYNRSENTPPSPDNLWVNCLILNNK
ncbi:hypothetical protein BK727_05760 [Bacillus thuringiensis serovar roskildiensis]|uniref:Uncharacterized protein n=1 Tax=Bacillus thuringiensis serovar sooncheon TaxID=180891 RepID=A0A9Q5SME3_BACTU|nr:MULTISPECIES: hypothetical protein [Bacillus cereus group]OTW72408.1 hypothetical protein BK707_04715 [Bacillus thuringiensis serovar coreanensis]OTX49464.1 hypothetical protein BK724_08385 [Bacillus thuringiensis serovar sooncheon]OTX57358.1 hypothetical protein BK725_06095 [Bacillus thuringiensis serovar guiyangiensis]OTX71797.1 hypothetical protein BK727_05760 [Bacillus thuringiensis serovar roskildiensis]